MKLHPGLLGQQDVPGHDHILHGIGDPFHPQAFCILISVHHAAFHHVDILAVSKYGHSLVSGNLHRLAVETGVHHGFPVLTEPHAAGMGHSLNIGQFFSLLPPGHGSQLKHMSRRFLGRTLCNRLIFLPVINGRKGIGHSHHRGHPAFHRGLSAGSQGLLILQSRIPQMYMKIDKSRHHITAFRLQHTGFLFPDLRRDPQDLSFLNQDICLLHRSCRRIHNLSISNQNLHSLSFPRISR